MTKPGSPHEVTFYTDPDDSHFIIIEVRKKADGLLSNSHYIIESDLQQWKRKYQRDGFVIQEEQR
jgi:hypothetical protein